MLGRGPHSPTDPPLCSRLPVGGAVGHRHLLLVHSQPLAERRDQLPDHHCCKWPIPWVLRVSRHATVLRSLRS